MRALRKRYGRAKYYGLGSGVGGNVGAPDLDHVYKALLRSMRGNGGNTKSMWRHWEAQRGVPKALTDRVLTVAERRGHVEVREGRYYLTPYGYEAAWPYTRDGAS